jgi:tripartite-type tricarboxylate transporter receptor subunit TctC
MSTLRCVLGLLLVHALLGHAQTYPAKPIRLIVPAAAGSPPDIVARILGERLTAALGQPIVVDNRPGASGTIGLAAVAKAPPDGYTIGMIAMSFTVAPSLVAQLSYDTTRDLAAVAQVVWSSNVLVVRADSWRSVDELVAAAKARPGELTFSSGGNATPAHLAGESFKLRAGVDMRHVPFKGTVPGVAAVMGAQVDMMFATTGVVAGHLKSGRLRALATTAPARLDAYPDIPTLAERGYTAFDMRDWHGVVAPAATPKEIISRLSREVRGAILQPEANQRLVAAVLDPTPDSTPEQFGALIRSELDRWAKVVKQAGIRAD